MMASYHAFEHVIINHLLKCIHSIIYSTSIITSLHESCLEKDMQIEIELIKKQKNVFVN